MRRNCCSCGRPGGRVNVMSVSQNSVIEDVIGTLNSGSRVILQGSKLSGRTSLLFNHAYCMASRGVKVFFVCLQNSIEKKLPLPFSSRAGQKVPVRDSLWDAKALSGIGMKYVKGREDLQWWLGNVQRLPKTQQPSAIIVDDLNTIINLSSVSTTPPDYSTALYCLALLEDAAQYLGAALVVALGPEACLPIPALRRYFPQVVETQQNAGAAGSSAGQAWSSLSLGGSDNSSGQFRTGSGGNFLEYRTLEAFGQE